MFSLIILGNGKVQDLFAYQKGFDLAMRILHVSKTFPKEEQYSMTDQIRRSSRSVVVNLSEAYRRRRTKKYFEAKLNDCETEMNETQTWLAFAKACGYITDEQFTELNNLADAGARLLHTMASDPGKFM